MRIHMCPLVCVCGLFFLFLPTCKILLVNFFFALSECYENWYANYLGHDKHIRSSRLTLFNTSLHHKIDAYVRWGGGGGGRACVCVRRGELRRFVSLECYYRDWYGTTIGLFHRPFAYSSHDFL